MAAKICVGVGVELLLNCQTGLWCNLRAVVSLDLEKVGFPEKDNAGHLHRGINGKAELLLRLEITDLPQSVFDGIKTNEHG